MTALIIILSVILLIFVLLLIPFELYISFLWNENERKTTVRLKYLIFKYNLSDKKKKEKNKKTDKKPKKKYTTEDVKKTVKFIKESYGEISSEVGEILSYAKNNSVTIKDADINIIFDLEDPMKTGIATGVINGSVYNILGILDNTVSVKKMKVNIVPVFENKKYFDVNISSIVKTKNAHIIFILIKAIKVLLKLRKLSRKNGKKI